MSNSRLYEEYLQKEEVWAKIEKTHVGPSPKLITESYDTPDSRVYQKGDSIIKIRRLADFGPLETRLYKEYLILEYLEKKTRKRVFQPLYKINQGFEVLTINRINGHSVERLLETKKLSIKHVIEMIIAVCRLNAAGVCHRDLKPSNILVDDFGRIRIIDFDQAITTSAIRAFINDFIGLGLRIPKSIHPLRRIIQRAINYKFPSFKWWTERSNQLGKRGHSNHRNTSFFQFKEKSPVNEEISKLKKAWELAALSNANSPGMNLAYYSLSLGGYGFVGERSWESRWRPVRDLGCFQGKRIVELGCNVGLFSVFFRLSGASECLGLDSNKEIISAARMVAAAFGVDNKYAVQDLDENVPWEDTYKGFDFAIALSVFNWVKQKPRFLEFLGRHQELLYEGHDSFDIESDRLMQCGFKSIQLVTISERGRFLFYAKK